MCSWSPCSGQMLPFPQPQLVLSVNGKAPAASVKGCPYGFLVIEQEIAGRGPEERLDASNSVLAFKLSQSAGIRRRCTNIECIVAVHAAIRAGEFVGNCGSRCGRRTGVWHFEHGSYAAKNRRATSTFKVLFVFIARFA